MNKKSITITIIAITILAIGAGVWRWEENKKVEEVKKQEVAKQGEVKKEEEKKQEEVSEINTSDGEFYQNEEYKFKNISLPSISFNYKAIANSISEKIIKSSDSCRIGYSSIGFGCGPSYKYYLFETKEEFKKIEYPTSKPKLIIYPFHEYNNYLKKKSGNDKNDSISGRLDSFNDNLSNSYLEKTAKEIFPIPNASGGPIAYSKYIDFKDGFGVRAIYYYTQSHNPPSNGSFFYSFQGLTNDKKYLISFRVDLFSPNLQKFYDNNELPKVYYQVTKENSQAEAYDKYIEDAFSAIELEKEKDFSPSILLLDDIVSSIKIVD
jgi:hypothetical protein